MSTRVSPTGSPEMGIVPSIKKVTAAEESDKASNTETDSTIHEDKMKMDGKGIQPQQPESKLPPAKKSAKDFVFGKLLGEGSFSSVYLAKDVKTGKEYAIKVCDKQHIIKERKTESIRREKDVLAILSANRSATAPFFVHLYATFQDSQRLYFVMTFCHGGELLKYLNKFGSFESKCCRFYAGEILQALRHLHQQGIVHRDLKPENILLNEKGHILVTDFGSAKVFNCSKNDTGAIEQETEDSGRTRSNSFVGTAQYVSPEVLRGKYSEVGPPADLWALGCILFQLACGVPPFQAPNEFLIFQKILKLEYDFPEDFDAVTRDLVRKLLVLEPQERLGVSDIEPYTSIQSHPFFKDINLDTLCDETPPQMLPYSSTGDPPSSPLRSQHCIPDTFEPGFNPRVIAERVLRSEEDFPWESNQRQQLSESSVDTPDSDSSHAASSPSNSRRENNNGSMTPPTTLMEKLSMSQNVDGNKRQSSIQSIEEGRVNKSMIPIDGDDRQSRIREQSKNNPWHPAVKGSLILKQGLVSKRKGLFSRRRMMLLTEGPHLYYCDPSSMTVKGEIPWSASLKPEAKDFKNFFVHTPNRTYYLEDPEGYALEWCKAINEVRQRTFGEENQPERHY